LLVILNYALVWNTCKPKIVCVNEDTTKSIVPQQGSVNVLFDIVLDNLLLVIVLYVDLVVECNTSAIAHCVSPASYRGPGFIGEAEVFGGASLSPEKYIDSILPLATAMLVSCVVHVRHLFPFILCTVINPRTLSMLAVRSRRKEHVNSIIKHAHWCPIVDVELNTCLFACCILEGLGACHKVVDWVVILAREAEDFWACVYLHDLLEWTEGRMLTLVNAQGFTWSDLQSKGFVLHTFRADRSRLKLFRQNIYLIAHLTLLRFSFHFCYVETFVVCCL
jgi:hypothetical protein